MSVSMLLAVFRLSPFSIIVLYLHFLWSFIVKLSQILKVPAPQDLVCFILVFVFILCCYEAKHWSKFCIKTMWACYLQDEEWTKCTVMTGRLLSTRQVQHAVRGEILLSSSDLHLVLQVERNQWVSFLLLLLPAPEHCGINCETEGVQRKKILFSRLQGY